MTAIARKLAAATSVALLAASGVAAAADAPIVSAQKTSTATTAPLTIPGTGIQKGERLPSGARLVYRDVTLEGDQTATFNLEAPAGKRLRGLAPRSNSIGFSVVDKGDYSKRGKVRVRAFAAPHADSEVTGRIYGLVR
ncbi:MAG TPA: hypothetical protein VMY78_09670 [Solirubrobacteraceae bacterium]|nr:hypothetical protein [Solirubrobacteraceae bacterium]